MRLHLAVFMYNGDESFSELLLKHHKGCLRAYVSGRRSLATMRCLLGFWEILTDTLLLLPLSYFIPLLSLFPSKIPLSVDSYALVVVHI